MTGSAQTFKIFTHKKIEVGYNGNQIVDVNLTSDGRMTLQPGVKLDFSYEVDCAAAALCPLGSNALPLSGHLEAVEHQFSRSI